MFVCSATCLLKKNKMVVSKRCKICTIIEADNFPISGEYFGRPIPEIIEKISGIEVGITKRLFYPLTVLDLHTLHFITVVGLPQIG